MLNDLRMAAGKLSFTLAISLCASWAVTASAEGTGLEVTSALAAAAVAPVQELDEVWVHGKRLADRIEEAEDDFFRLYNALNEDDRFDVNCGMMALHAGSMIMQRTCIPGFLAVRLHSPRLARPAFSLLYSPDSCWSAPAADSSLPTYADGCSPNSGPTAFSMDRYMRTSFHPASVPLALEALHYREQYADTVLAVIHGDDRLQKKAAHLAQLYEDLDSTQRQYRELKAAKPAAWSLHRKSGGPGPRSR